MTKVHEALQWLLNMADGVGRDGGPVRPGEFEAALAFARQTLKDRLTLREVVRGSGLPNDPRRMVKQFVTDDGTVWFEYDEYDSVRSGADA